MSNERPDAKTKSAFLSPTRLTARRLSQHQYRGPRGLSPTGSDVSAYSARSRRSQSMIRSQDDAEVFEQIASATGVRVASSKRKTRMRDCSSPPVTSNLGSTSFDVMRSLSPTSFAGSDLGAYPSMDQYDNKNFFNSEKNAYVENKDYFRKDQVPLESSSLDFIQNDNSFQVLASVMVDFFDARVRNGQLTLEANDSELIDRLLPASARRHFIEAVQYRLERTPALPQSQLDFLTVQCQELGLDRDGPENPIIATAMLDENETFVTLPVLGSKSKEEIKRTNSDGSDSSEPVWVDLVDGEQPPPPAFPESGEPAKGKTSSYETSRVGPGKPKEVSPPLPARNPVVLTDQQNVQKRPSFDFPDPDSTDNIAQRTLLMELHEARQMMQASSSPETVEFWENHIEDLKAKYRALIGKPRLSSAPILPPSPTTTIDTHEYPSALQSMSMESAQHHVSQSQQPQEHNLEPRRPAQAPQPMQPKKSVFFPQQTPVSQQASDPQLTSSVDPSLTFLQQTPLTYQAPDPRPSNQVQSPVSVPPQTPNPPATPGRTSVVPTDDVDNGSIAPRTPNPPATPATTSVVRQMAPSHVPEPDYNIPMVDVVAPADLPGGYNFEAEIEGQRFLATVPAGGVKEGETFTCYMRQLDSMAIDIPIGYWRDGVLGFCAYGCCHPVAWNSILCPLITLAQVQYRSNLDFLGRPNLFQGAASNRAMMVTIIMFWIMINAVLFLGYNVKWSQSMELTVADWSSLAVINGAYLCFIVFVTQSTRSSLREKYLIREQICSDLEDLCCATCCLPCSISQMSRHTGNYDEYEAVCCSRTGLPDGVGEHEQTSLRPSQNGPYLV